MNDMPHADNAEADTNGFTPEPVDKRRVVVLISGNGSNLQALIDAQRHDELGGEIVAVISNRGDAYGLVRAKEAASTPWCCPIRNTTTARPMTER